MSAGYEVFDAFGGLEDVDEVSDEAPQSGDGALARFAQHGLEVREGFLDGIKIGTVGRQEQQPGTSRVDHFSHRSALVARQSLFRRR